MKNNKNNKKHLPKTFSDKMKNILTKENIKNFLLGHTTGRRMFRMYFLILFIGAGLLYLPISIQPFIVEGFDGAVHHLAYYDNAYHMTLGVGAAANEISFSFLDCLFMAFSAFSDTGLSLHSLIDLFSTFGQVVLILLIQVGGFGIMFFIFLIWKLFRGSDKITINQALLAQSEKGNTKIGNTDKMLITSSLFIITLEVVFALFYSLWFLYVPAYTQQSIAIDGYPPFQWPTRDTNTLVYVYDNPGAAFFAGLFHSVSVINNAGFDLLGGDSLASYRNDVHSIFLFVTAGQFILGGIGFPIIYDMLLKFKISFSKVKFKWFIFYKMNIVQDKEHRLSLFTKLSTWTYFIVAFVGILMIFLFECTVVGGGDNIIWNTDSGMFGDGPDALVYYNKSVNLIFQSLSTRSAGYATFSNDLMNPISKWLNTALMFIGGSASSTAGGIRTTTLAIVFLAIYARLRGSNHINIFKRKINPEDVLNSFVVLIVALVLIFIGGIVLTSSLRDYKNTAINSNEVFTNVIFLCTSAFGTTGLSVASLANIGWASEIYLMLLMFVGQYGVSSTILAFRRKNVKANLFEYQMEDVRIG